MKTSYIPKPLDTSKIRLSADLMELTEMLARNTHEVWAKQRIADGWQYGAERNDARCEHPSIVPYEQLSEQERQYDYNTSQEVLKVILKLGFKIEK